MHSKGNNEGQETYFLYKTTIIMGRINLCMLSVSLAWE